MVSYFVRYRGVSSDPDAFHSYYETGHATLLRRFPGIRSLVLHRPAPWSDPFPVQRGGTLLLAQMQFDSASDLDRALRSDARRQAREDLARFPPFSGEVTHEAMAGKMVF
jgi:uncharacterized protein (TIGR02118 family)